MRCVDVEMTLGKDINNNAPPTVLNRSRTNDFPKANLPGRIPRHQNYSES